MRIVMVVVGSRGDVQPCVALAAGLRDAGFDVLVAAPHPSEGFVTGSGLAFSALPVDPSGLLGGDAGRAWVESGRSPIGFLRGLRDVAVPLLEPFADAVADACAGADAIVYTTLAFPGWHVAQSAHVPAIQVAFAPVSPTAAFPPLLFPAVFAGDPWGRTMSAALARAYHRAGHLLFAQALWLPLRSRLNAWRRSRLGLAPAGWRSPALQVERDGELLLQAFSPTVLPPPPDWGPHVATTGYWFLDTPEAWRPPEQVTAFLAGGPPPVSIGMGSMTGRDPAGLAEIAVEALRRTGQRGVLLSGWAELGAAIRAAAPDDVDLLVVDELPHDWLFMGRVTAAVHHGGAGTTAASLRAGTPTVVIPHFGDQPLWGDRVHALGAGPAPIPRRELTSGRLAHAISAAVHDARIRDRAAEVGRAVRAERGVAAAVTRIGRLVEGRAAGAPR